jgi:hypothetical protein
MNFKGGNIIMFNQLKKTLSIFLIVSPFIISSDLKGQTRTVDDARFINQSVPNRMAPGQTYNLIITFENTGTTFWMPGEYSIKVTSGDNYSPSDWSMKKLDLVRIIEPGNSVSFEVPVTAPSTEGVYTFKAHLLHGDYVFGETSIPHDITVSSQVRYSEALNSSAFVEQSVPSHMEIGNLYKISIAMTNTGKTVWTPGMYRLVMLDASGKAYSGNSWNMYSENLSESIPPGGTKVFIFDIAPFLPGNFTLQWRMASSETGLFGDASSPSVVTVKLKEVEKSEGKRGREIK